MRRTSIVAPYQAGPARTRIGLGSDSVEASHARWSQLLAADAELVLRTLFPADFEFERALALLDPGLHLDL